MEKNGYKPFKKLCRENGLQSQQALVDFKNLEKKGYFDSLIRQITSKIGFRAWTVQRALDLPKQEILMMIGADVYHKRGKESVASVVATVDPEFSRFVSRSSLQPKYGQEVMTNIAQIVLDLVQAFQAKNKRIPTTIVFFRDGVGKGQYEEVKRVEVSRINNELKMQYGDAAPKLDFILVNKRINDRFFQDGTDKYGKKCTMNPESGIIVDTHCTSDQYKDFFMVAQNVTQGTATPTHYTFLQKESDFGDETMFSMTYFQTFNYAGWAGPVKVPAVCQHAHKLAYMIGETNKG